MRAFKLPLKVAAVIAALATLPLLMGPTGQAPGIPPPIVCATVCTCAAVVPGQSCIITSATNNETRTSTIAISKSTIYDITAAPTGTYRVTGHFQWAANAAGGFRGTLNFGSTCGVSGPGEGTYTLGTVVSAAQNVSIANGIALTAAFDELYFTGYMSGTGPIELSLCWAQSVSNAASTQIDIGGGFLQIERLN